MATNRTDIFSLQQLREGGEESGIEHLLSRSGKLAEVIILSAYTSPDYLRSKVWKTLKAKLLSTSQVRIFIDMMASGVLADSKALQVYKTIDANIRKTCSEGSGLFLVKCKALFHPKLYYLRSNLKAKLFIGSVNMSERGFEKNEEFVARLGDADSRSTGKWLSDEYLPWLFEKNTVTSVVDFQNLTINDLRSLLLGGRLFYTANETYPFRFKLYLPEEILVERSSIHSLLEGATKDSVDGLALLGLKLQPKKDSESKGQWKKLAIQTSYGLWVPKPYIPQVNAVINQRQESRIANVKRTISSFTSRRTELQRRFMVFVGEVNQEVERRGFKWEIYPQLEQRWKKWLEHLDKKLNSEQFIKRIVVNIESAKVPDVWGDPVSAEDFEVSFLEQLQYSWVRVKSKETNIVANPCFRKDVGSFKSIRGARVKKNDCSQALFAGIQGRYHH